jgi:hypothetical protein
MNPRIGIERAVVHSRGNLEDPLRSHLWNTHYYNKRLTSPTGTTKASWYDEVLMEKYRHAYSFGVDRLKQFFIAYEGSVGTGVPPSSVFYYKNHTLNGPFRAYGLQRVYNAEIFWRHHSSLCGITGDINNRSYLSTPIYDYTTKVNDENIVTQTKLPPFMYNMIHNLRTATRGMFYQNIFGSLRLDNTLPLVEKNFTKRQTGERTNTFQKTPHGQRMVADVNRYTDLTVKEFEKPILGGKSPKPALKTYVTSFTEPPVNETKTGRPTTAKEDDNVYQGWPGCESCACVRCIGGDGYVWAYFLPFNSPAATHCRNGGQFTIDWEMYRYFKLYNPFASNSQQAVGHKGVIKYKADWHTEQKIHKISNNRLEKGTKYKFFTSTISTDYHGNPHESNKRRAKQVTLTSGGFKQTLHTVPGTLGHKR